MALRIELGSISGTALGGPAPASAVPQIAANIKARPASRHAPRSTKVMRVDILEALSYRMMESFQCGCGENRLREPPDVIAIGQARSILSDVSIMGMTLARVQP